MSLQIVDWLYSHYFFDEESSSTKGSTQATPPLMNIGHYVLAFPAKLRCKKRPIVIRYDYFRDFDSPVAEICRHFFQVSDIYLLEGIRSGTFIYEGDCILYNTSIMTKVQLRE